MATNTSILGLTKPAYNDDADVSVINANMDLIDAESGRLRGNFAGTYDATATYAVGVYCIYQGNLYRCTTAIGSGGEAWTAGHWAQVSVGEEITSLNGKIQNVDTTTVITNLTDIPLNSQGRIRLGSAVSPTGAEAVFNYICLGTAGKTTLEVNYTNTNRTFVNTNEGGTWTGWKELALNYQIANHDVLATSDVITIGTESAWDNKLCAIKSNGLYLVSLIRINNSNVETTVHSAIYTGDQLLVGPNNPVYFYSNTIGDATKSILISCASVSGYFSYYVGASCVVGNAPKIKIQIRKLIVL